MKILSSLTGVILPCLLTFRLQSFFSIREVVSFFDLLSCPKYMNTIPLTICEILCILQKNLFRVTNTTTFVPILRYFLLECYISRIAGGASLNFQSWHQNYKNCYRKVLSVTARNKVKPGRPYFDELYA